MCKTTAEPQCTAPTYTNEYKYTKFYSLTRTLINQLFTKRALELNTPRALAHTGSISVYARSAVLILNVKQHCSILGVTQVYSQIQFFTFILLNMLNITLYGK